MKTHIGAVIHARWEADNATDTCIIGFWAEDGSPYEVIVPEQLRQPILDMQNALARNYAEIQSVTKYLNKAKQTLQDLGFDD